MTNLLTRNSPRELTTPFPSKNEMREIYEAALRAPDHAWLRPSRFIEVTGAGLDKRSEERRVGKECRSRWSPYH